MNLFAKVVIVVAKLKVVWKAWDVRSFIVASFTFQLFLILFAQFRKRTSSGLIRISTWFCYLLADWVAAQVVGLIANTTQVSSDTIESDLFGLWAQFLLLHLGGPHTITALALEDNELWLRTVLHLSTQAYATLGILVRSVRQSTLWVATVLMFLAGIIRYFERVTSLHHGHLMDINDFPYQEYLSKLLEDPHEEGKSLTNVTMVRGAYWLFQAYKRLYADLQLDHDVRKDARKYFLERTSEEAYRMIEMQLNFMYEAMYTKMVIIHKTAWKILCEVVLSLQVACLVIWFLWDKRGFRAYDVRVTYVLFIGAIAMDVLAFLRIQLSDWSIALLQPKSRIRSRLYNKLLNARNSITWPTNPKRKSWVKNVFLGRWSVSICNYYGLTVAPTRLEELMESLHLQNNQHRRTQITKRLLSSKIWDFIFERLTKPCELTYELPDSGIVNTNEMLVRGLPIHILDYVTVLQCWSKTSDMWIGPGPFLAF